MKIAHLTTHMNVGGIPVYIQMLTRAHHAMGLKQIVISTGGTLEESMRALDIPTFHFDLRTKFEFHPKLFWAIPGIIRILKQEKVDLIHSHTRVTQVLAAIIEKLTGIKHISTCHGFYQPRLGRKIFPAWGHRVIAISSLVKNDLLKTHSIAEASIRQITNGIDVGRFVKASAPELRAAARVEWGLSPDHFAICMIARLIIEKGPEDFVQAIALLNSKYPNLRGFIVGDGPDAERVWEKIKNLGLTNCIRLTGNVANVERILAACDAFIHPVRVPEGFGLSIAEAMATGVPVIVNDQWALKEVFHNNNNNMGELIPSKNPSKIATCLTSWMDDPERVKAMGINAQKFAIEYFDMARLANEVMAIYEEVVPNR